MKIEIEIPKEFEEHFNQDRFEGALQRLSGDAHLIAGNYEQETAIMLIKAFKEGKIREEKYEEQIMDRGYERLKSNLEIMEEMGRLKALDKPVILENDGYRINITAQFNLPYGLPFRDRDGYGSEYEAYYGSLSPIDGETEEVMLFFRDGDNNLFISEILRDDFVSNTEAYIMNFKVDPIHPPEDASYFSSIFSMDSGNITRIADFIKDRGGQEMTENREVTEFVKVTFRSDRIREFKSAEGKELCGIKAGQGYEYVRPRDKVYDSKTEGYSYINLPADYEMMLTRSVKNASGGYDKEQLLVNATELQERHNKYDVADDFITISVSKKRVVQNFSIKTDNGPVEYSKILAPGGVSFLRKSDQIHEDRNNPDKVCFSLHKSNKIKIERRTDTVEGHTPAGKPIYHTEKEEISPEVLKRIYDEEGKQRQRGTDISAPQEPIPVPSRGR